MLLENRFLRHLFFWLFYWLAMGFVGGRYDMLFARAYLHEGAELPLRMLMVYAVLARTPVLGQGNWWRWLLEVCLILFATTLAVRLLMYSLIYPWLYQSDYTFTFWNDMRLIYSFLDLALLLFLVLALRFARQYMDFSAQKQALVLEKTKAELNALRHQTHPHFLFNTLTSIYTLAQKNAPETAEIVHRLSQLLRFMLYECNVPAIPVSREVQVIESYIAIEKMRFGDRVTVKSDCDIADHNFEITPLLLLPLFENAFKHGASESRHHFWLEWQLQVENGQLDFSIANSHEKAAPLRAAGIGLSNFKKQLALAYPGHHQLTITDENGRFSVQLHISTQQH